jgi:hypothetical protein
MKKFLLLIPIGLLGAAGFFWVSNQQNLSSINTTTVTEIQPHNAQELFTDTEHSLRQIVRHGDVNAIIKLKLSLNAISTELSERQKKGNELKELTSLIAQYKYDSTLLSEKFTPYIKQLHQYDQFEQIHEKIFLTSLEQIGLYELKTSYKELDKLRTDYIKAPSDQTKIAYVTQSDKIKQIISELYLDSTIDKPLFDYLTNHRHYFEMIDTAYHDIGFEHIQQLRSNGYAIKTELQLLPIL